MIETIGNILFNVVYIPCLLIALWYCRDIFAFLFVMVGWWIFCQANELSPGAWIGYLFIAAPIAFLLAGFVDNPKKFIVSMREVYYSAKQKVMDR